MPEKLYKQDEDMALSINAAAYIQLPERFYQKLSATELPHTQLLYWNSLLANDLQLNGLSDEQKLRIFSGQDVSLPAVAQAYAGHQFGYFSSQLGDGRARLIGDVQNREGKLFEVHLKGSGATAFSRRGDGFATLSSVLRELLVSEGMFGLGVPTSRTLAVMTTGEKVQRETEQPGGLLVRVAASHVRVGTFEYFASRRDVVALRALADFVIERHEPQLKNSTDKYEQLFAQIVQKQIQLICQWMRIGFIHGVMNTDNTFVSGETLDYGPCAFMEAYDPLAVFSSIDQRGRYAYARQPQILHWNLQNLAYCLGLLIDGKELTLPPPFITVLENFDQDFTSQWQKVMGEKIGINASAQEDTSLIRDYFDLLHKHQMDFTLGFRNLSEQLKSEEPKQGSFFEQADVGDWLKRWKQRLAQETKTNLAVAQSMDAVNPLYIPRNHLVEKAINKMVQERDLSLVKELVQVWQTPYDVQEGKEMWERPATDAEKVTATFCGT